MYRYLTFTFSILLIGVAFILGFPRHASAARTRSADYDMLYNKTCFDGECHPTTEDRGMILHIPYLEGQCLYCHEDHSSEEPQLLKKGGDELCLECHTDIELDASTNKLLHPPGDENCLKCHNPHKSRVRNLLRDSKKLTTCASCHSDFLNKAKQKPYRHEYFDPTTMCGNCHYAHTHSDHFYLRENVAESCLTCHDISITVNGRRLENVGNRLAEAPYVHGAMKLKSCPSCHTPHGSDQASLLLPGYPTGTYANYERDQYNLCWECHDPQLVEAEEGENYTGFRNDEKNLHRVHVFELHRGRACHICHAPHTSNKPHLIRETITFKEWKSPMTYKAMPDGGSCQTPCHREKVYKR
jgi:predicted CXXCH cytochrome family protein